MVDYVWEPELDRVVYPGVRYRFAVVVPNTWSSDQTQAFLEGKGWNVTSIGVPPSDVAAAISTLQTVGLNAPTGWWLNAVWQGAANAQLPVHDGDLYYASLDSYRAVQPGDVPVPATPDVPQTPPKVTSGALLGLIAGALVVGGAIMLTKHAGLGGVGHHQLARENPLGRWIMQGIKRGNLFLYDNYYQHKEAAIRAAKDLVSNERFIPGDGGIGARVLDARTDQVVFQTPLYLDGRAAPEENPRRRRAARTNPTNVYRGSVEHGFYVVQSLWSDGRIEEEVFFDDEALALRAAHKQLQSPFRESESVRVITIDGQLVWDSKEARENPTGVPVYEGTAPEGFISFGRGAFYSLAAAQKRARKECSENIVIVHHPANRLYGEVWYVGFIQPSSHILPWRAT